MSIQETLNLSRAKIPPDPTSTYTNAHLNLALRVLALLRHYGRNAAHIGRLHFSQDVLQVALRSVVLCKEDPILQGFITFTYQIIK